MSIIIPHAELYSQFLASAWLVMTAFATINNLNTITTTVQLDWKPSTCAYL